MPIYAQLVDAIRRAIVTRQFRPGDQLPTVRQLAVELKVNPNTVARAYTELERAGVIATQQGRGTFVLEPSATANGSDDRERLHEVAMKALDEARRLGFTPQELLDALRTRIAARDAPGKQ